MKKGAGDDVREHRHQLAEQGGADDDVQHGVKAPEEPMAGPIACRSQREGIGSHGASDDGCWGLTHDGALLYAVASTSFWTRAP